MFIPSTHAELNKLNWQELDIILVSGDSYVDTSYSGIAIIGKHLIKNGYKVAIIPQPSLDRKDDIMRFGNPKLFWGVTAGAMDSMVANYTALKKKRRNDDLTAGGLNNRRPDRATIRYVNLIKQFADKNILIVIGGVEASLRRITHYDYWDNKVRRSILFDSKADILVYGEGERTILEIAQKIKKHEDIKSIRGICYITSELENDNLENYIELPTHEESIADKQQFRKMFDIFYKNNDPINAKKLVQKVGDRFLIQNPPNYYLQEEELDEIYNYDYENKAAPIHSKEGKVKALETIKSSITSHRGCFGECNFCAIAVHFGRTIRSRSYESILKETEKIANSPKFNGIIYDIGGASANMYKMKCEQQELYGSCKDKRCLSPTICKNREISHKEHLNLIAEVAKLNKINKVFINSGIRYDLVLNDKKFGKKYLEYVVSNCVSGQMKIAPEHTDPKILKLMAKPLGDLNKFVQQFKTISKNIGKKQFLTYYLIAAHPGCTIEDMRNMKKIFLREIKILPEQVQIFTPTPSTYSTLMYYLEEDFQNPQEIFVEKNLNKMKRQKEEIVSSTRNKVLSKR